MEEENAGFTMVLRKRRRVSPSHSTSIEDNPSPSRIRMQSSAGASPRSSSENSFSALTAMAAGQVGDDEGEVVDASFAWQVPAVKGGKKGNARKKQHLQPRRRANGEGPSEAVVERAVERSESNGESDGASVGSDVLREDMVAAQLLLKVAADGRVRAASGDPGSSGGSANACGERSDDRLLLEAVSFGRVMAYAEVGGPPPVCGEGVVETDGVMENPGVAQVMLEADDVVGRVDMGGLASNGGSVAEDAYSSSEGEGVDEDIFEAAVSNLDRRGLRMVVEQTVADARRAERRHDYPPARTRRVASRGVRLCCVKQGCGQVFDTKNELRHHFYETECRPAEVDYPQYVAYGLWRCDQCDLWFDKQATRKHDCSRGGTVDPTTNKYRSNARSKLAHQLRKVVSKLRAARGGPGRHPDADNDPFAGAPARAALFAGDVPNNYLGGIICREGGG